ncbi:hypothetical protein TNCV_2347861 [Trichonephila clavipes]|uniref:Uncharacterized protein n=1 Tax=Trichonephila clavipes TaxID=2585209 RepID=A0A8X6SPY0_TRICX|nr:hypothetical protein TNCV_2347861 [Trichonephila clavipes]
MRDGKEIQFHRKSLCRVQDRVGMYNVTVQQPLTSVTLNINRTTSRLQAEAGFVIKHNVDPFRCPGPLFITPFTVQMPVVSS